MDVAICLGHTEHHLAISSQDFTEYVYVAQCIPGKDFGALTFGDQRHELTSTLLKTCNRQLEVAGALSL